MRGGGAAGPGPLAPLLPCAQGLAAQGRRLPPGCGDGARGEPAPAGGTRPEEAGSPGRPRKPRSRRFPGSDFVPVTVSGAWAVRAAPGTQTGLAARLPPPWLAAPPPARPLQLPRLPVGKLVEGPGHALAAVGEGGSWKQRARPRHRAWGWGWLARGPWWSPRRFLFPPAPLAAAAWGPCGADTGCPTVQAAQ